MDSLAEPFRVKAERFEENLDRLGLPFKILKTRIRFTDQAELFMCGREHDSGVITVVDKTQIRTNCRAGHVPGNWGLSVTYGLDLDHEWWDSEVGPVSLVDTGYTNGVLTRPVVKLAWQRFGKTARDMSLKWGGDFIVPELGLVFLPDWQKFRPQNWIAIAADMVTRGL